MLLHLNRESTSKPASWSAATAAQPLHYGSWPASPIPSEFLACFLLLNGLTHLVSCFGSQTSYVLQPQVYGYDDLQMLQTRIPLVRSCSGLISRSISHECNKLVCLWCMKQSCHFWLLQDYYSIPFATPTTALTGREGSLTSNPYSGEMLI